MPNPVGVPSHTPDCIPIEDEAELVSNPGFETSNPSNGAAGWAANVWGGGTLAYQRDTTDAHGGGAAQIVHIRTLGSGGALYEQPITLAGGTVYQASVWLRSPDGAVVDFELRRAGKWYEPGAEQRITLSPAWTKYTIRGGFAGATPSIFDVNFDSTGTVEIDDASLHALSRPDCVATAAPIPGTYLGMDVIEWGSYPTWPSELGFGMLRLWDTGTRWQNLEPQPGVWNWSRMDYYVNTAVRNHEQILYTLGMPPQWASSNPNDPQHGADAPPANLADWRTYVRTVATRYKGRIHAWEIWNESDQSFYSGSPEELAVLTEAAWKELKAVDPTNVVLSPNFTTAGLVDMNRFLDAGGGKYVDAMSIHMYPHLTPEDDYPFVAAVRDELRRAGITGMPIWNTEGATGTSASSDQEAAGLVARSYLLQWAWGIKNFDWYTWDSAVGSPLSEPDHVTPTEAGAAYEQVGGWLRGSRMLAVSHAANGTWTVTLERADGTRAYAVWNTHGGTTFAIPSAWIVGHSTDLAGGLTRILTRTVTIGVAPVLLGSDAAG
jgi:hypothetical protein